MILPVGDKPKIVQEGWSDLEYVGLDEKGNAKFKYIRKDEYRAHHLKYEQYLKWKKNRNPKRSELEKKYGFDCKHGCHLIRLLNMGYEILKYKTVFVDREEFGDVQLYRDIRNGKYTYEELISMAKEIENKIEEEYKTSDLRYSADQEEISNLLVEIYDEFWR